MKFLTPELKDKLFKEYKNFTYLVCLLVACFIIVGVKGYVEANKVLYNPGTYTGYGVGVFGGEIKVTITVDKNSIVSVDEIVGDGETPEFGGAYINSGEAEAQIMEAQGQFESDGVSGATKPRDGIQTALNDALAQASVAK